MNTELKSAFEAEMAAAQRLIRAGQLQRAMRHLETAHVLGQNHVLPHVRSHWSMLRVELKRGSVAGACGQVIRIFLGALGSAIGIVPVGNPGGSNINMFASRPIDPDVAELIERDRSSG